MVFSAFANARRGECLKRWPRHNLKSLMNSPCFWGKESFLRRHHAGPRPAKNLLWLRSVCSTYVQLFVQGAKYPTRFSVSGA